MNLNQILCPIDFSDFNQAANNYASVLAESTGAKLVYLHASLPEVPYGPYAPVDMQVDLKEDLERLQEVVPTVAGVACEYVVQFGSASEQILEYAEKNLVDLIIMGTHGRSGIQRVLMGSVAEAVVRQAKCPVLAIKADARVPSQ